MIERSQAVTPHSKEIINDAMGGEKSLRLTRRFEPAHLPFAVSSRLMRHLSAIVGVTASVVSDVGHDGSLCMLSRVIAPHMEGLRSSRSLIYQ
jgi:hypothetical protein